MFCSNCGSQVNSEAAFCPNCGARLTPANLTQQSQTVTSIEDKPEEDANSLNPDKCLLWGILLTIGVYLLHGYLFDKYDFKVDEFRTYFTRSIAELLNIVGIILLGCTLNKGYKYRILGIIVFIIGIILAIIYPILFFVDLWHLIFD